MRAAELFAARRHVAEACRDHPFVRGIATGDLPLAAFRVYVGQDAAFLDAFVRAYALGLARAPDRDALLAFKALLDGGLEELALHRGYAERWGVDLDPEPLPATSAYTDLLLRVAALEAPGVLCAALAPCMRLYAWLGRELAPMTEPASAYAEWVATYAAPGFEALAATLEGLLDRLGGAPAAVERVYGAAMACELAFFDAAWRAGGDPA